MTALSSAGSAPAGSAPAGSAPTGSAPTGAAPQGIAPDDGESRAHRGASVPQAVRTLRFAATSTGLTLRKGMFVFFTIALPIAMFLLFNALFGQEPAGGSTAGGGAAGSTKSGTLVMVNMAAYGGFGAAINAGAMIQLERANGWLRQLMVAGLQPRSFVIGKLVAAMVVVLPALGGVYLTGVLIGGVRITLAEAAASLGVIWLGMIPLVLLGLALGLALKPSAVQAAATIVLMVLAIIGGLWMPVAMFPSWVQSIAHGTPTYWIGQLGTGAVTGGALPGRGVLVLLAWTVGLAVISALLLRRATGSSTRR